MPRLIISGEQRMANSHDRLIQCTCGKITFSNGLWSSKLDRRVKSTIEKMLNVQGSWLKQVRNTYMFGLRSFPQKVNHTFISSPQPFPIPLPTLHIVLSTYPSKCFCLDCQTLLCWFVLRESSKTPIKIKYFSK